MPLKLKNKSVVQQRDSWFMKIRNQRKFEPFCLHRCLVSLNKWIQ